MSAESDRSYGLIGGASVMVQAAETKVRALGFAEAARILSDANRRVRDAFAALGIESEEAPLVDRERELERLARAAGYAEAIADVDAWLRAAHRVLLRERHPMGAKEVPQYADPADDAYVKRARALLDLRVELDNAYSAANVRQLSVERLHEVRILAAQFWQEHFK